MLENLLSNALKYGPPATPCVVKICEAGSDVAVSVSDGGTPIPAEHHARLFGRFYRVPGGPGTGLGLGLFIARLIVERHGGRIGVESRARRGNSFIITLPRDDRSPHAADSVLGEARLPEESRAAGLGVAHRPEAAQPRRKTPSRSGRVARRDDARVAVLGGSCFRERGVEPRKDRTNGKTSSQWQDG